MFHDVVLDEVRLMTRINLLSFDPRLAGLVLLAAAIGPVSASAQRVVTIVDGEDPAVVKSWHAVQNTTDPHSGRGAMEIPPGGRVESPNRIEIDPSRTYEFRGMFKTAEKDRKNKVWISLHYFDAQGQPLNFCSVWPMVGTETELAAAVKKGDLLDRHVPKQWVLPPPFLYAMAFDAKDDLSDLPNQSARLLDRPSDRDYPAGTRIRLHRYLDPPCVGGIVVPIWTEYSLTVSGEATIENPNRRPNGARQFWHGTKSIGVVITNWDRRGGRLLVDDVEIRESARNSR
jgi:hypothetical protein